MSYGLQLFDSSGTIRLDTADRFSRYVGDYTTVLNPPMYGTTTVLLSIPDMTNDGTWLFTADIVPAFISYNIVTGGISVTGYHSYSGAYTVKCKVFRF
jgi:hypothetical protein